jgi:hypothetical protein
MASVRYFVTSNGISNGDRMLPVGAGSVVYTSISMGDQTDRVDCYVEFFDASGNPVTPTGGTVHVYGLPMVNNWLEAAGSPINAADAGYPASTYNPPYMNGLVLFARVKFTDIVGAAFASVVFFKRVPR